MPPPLLPQFARAGEVQLAPAAGPQKEFHQAFQVKEIGFRFRSSGGCDYRLKTGDGAIRPLERDLDGD